MNGRVIVFLAVAGIVEAQPAAPQFEVASVKACKEGPAGRRSAGGQTTSPGRLDLNCLTVMDLIRTAYDFFANGVTRVDFPSLASVEGGPAWINSERYTIDAKAESPQSQEMMKGPMLQGLLEDRFKLKVHREPKDIPVYMLTVAKGGPKLQVAQAGKCMERDQPRVALEPGQPFPKMCGGFYPPAQGRGVVVYSTTMETLSSNLSTLLGRRVVDKTGIAGLYDLHVELELPDPARAASDPYTPNGEMDSLVFNVVKELGLKLESAKESGAILVIDRVERPSGN
jgi:uncharacterized protein (TIGR03435 family)